MTRLLAMSATYWVLTAIVGLGVAVAAPFIIRALRGWRRSKKPKSLEMEGLNLSENYNAKYWEEGYEDVDTGSINDTSAVANRPPDGTENITLRQHGRTIEGEITRTLPTGELRVSKFTGEYADMHITGMYRAKDPRNPERGSFCLKVADRGRILRGGYLWYNTAEGKGSIDFGKYVWEKT